MAAEDMYVYTVGPHRQLFVDDYLVAETEGLTKRLHQPRKHPENPILVGQGSEGEYLFFHGSILFDPGDRLYKVWYGTPGGYHYAKSEDGIHFVKPDLNLFPGAGRPGNVVFLGVFPDWFADRHIVTQGISVMLDDEADDPNQRFKLFTFHAPLPDAPEEVKTACPYGYYTATSPDGIGWEGRKQPVLTKKDNDPLMSDCNTCMFDPLGKRFIACTKRHVIRGDGTGDQDIMQRARGVSFSEDFVQWTKPVTCICPDDYDARDANFYRHNAWVYEGMYLGLLEVYYSSRTHPTKPMCRDVQLVSSRDGEHWFRAGNRETFIPIGGPGTWDAYLLDIPSNGPFLLGEELRFYYGGRHKHHNYHPDYFMTDDRGEGAIGLATLRRDGFVSYDAGDSPGTLLSKPFRFEKGDALYVNAQAPEGEIGVEIVEVSEDPGAPLRDWGIRYGEVLDGYGLAESLAFAGDSTGHQMAWSRGCDISRLAGSLVALRFRMRKASLYSWWIAG